MTAAAPLLSVTVLADGSAEHLDRCLRSVLDQTGTDLEVIVVDDGSEPCSLAVIDRYRRDPRVRVIAHETRRGVNASLIEGCAASASTYLAVVMAHDWVLDPGAFERQIALLERHPGMAFAWTAYACFGEGQEPDRVVRPWDEEQVLERPEALHEVLVERRVLHSGTVVRRRAYEAIGGYDVAIRHAVDTKMWAGLCHVGTVGYLPVVGCAHGLGAADTSTDLAACEESIDELLEILDWSRELLLVDERLDLEWIYVKAERSALAAYPALFAFRRDEIRTAWHFIAVGARRRLRPTVCQATTLVIAARTVLGRRLFALAEDPVTKRLRGRSAP